MGWRFASRLPFLIAAGVIAAASADPVVESISNTGLLGGRFHDDDHSGILPALIVGLFFVATFLALRFIEIVRHSERRSGDGFVEIARDFASRSAAQDFPCVFAIQLVALFALESAEQVTSGGALLGGVAWLGGPVLFSLAVHALIGAICTFALGVGMRAIVDAFASIVLTAIRFIWLAAARAARAVLALDRLVAFFERAQAPHARQLGMRAPPLVLASR